MATQQSPSPFLDWVGYLDGKRQNPNTLHVLGKMQNSITELLAKHPSIEWSRQEVVRMRYKRSLQFKDQYFPSQWHLVRVD